MNQGPLAFRSPSPPGHEALQEAYLAQRAELEQLQAECAGGAPRTRLRERMVVALLGIFVGVGIATIALVLQREHWRGLFITMQSAAIPLRPAAGREPCLLRFDRPTNSPYPHARVSCGVNLYDAEVHDFGAQLVDDRTDDGDGTLRVDFEEGVVEVDGARFVMERGDAASSRRTLSPLRTDG